MSKELARQFIAVRKEAKLAKSNLATLANVDRATITAVENGGGTMATVNQLAEALGCVVRPMPSSLGNKRRWLGIGTRKLATSAGISRPTLQAFESAHVGRVATYEAVCCALNEVPSLRRMEQTWWTPPELIGAILRALHIECFDLDPASPTSPTVPCEAFYTESDGGLWLPWRGVTFVNPPYDDVPRWLAKASAEFEAGHANLILGLVPYRPETNAWKTMVRSNAAVFVLENRLRFGGRNYVSPSVSALIIWGGALAQLKALGEALPPHHQVVRPTSTRKDEAIAPNR